LSKIAKIVNNRKTINAFEDVFIVQQKSMYVDKDHLALLTKKAEVFLLEIFSNIYQKLGRSSIVKGQDETITYKLASLNITIDKKQIPLGFSSEHLPTYNKCDHCHKLLYDETGKSFMVIIYGHGYHESCFSILLKEKCHYCENFLKLGVRNNVSSLLTRLSKVDKNKSNLKKLIDANEESPQNQKILNEDNILEVL
ncbi:20321_t:CDS:1, partial [Racocetra persica]